MPTVSFTDEQLATIEATLRYWKDAGGYDELHRDRVDSALAALRVPVPQPVQGLDFPDGVGYWAGRRRSDGTVYLYDIVEYTPNFSAEHPYAAFAIRGREHQYIQDGGGVDWYRLTMPWDWQPALPEPPLIVDEPDQFGVVRIWPFGREPHLASVDVLPKDPFASPPILERHVFFRGYPSSIETARLYAQALLKACEIAESLERQTQE